MIGPYKHNRFWFIRKVRHGRVRIMGHEWAPDEKWQKYDGRLDGLRLVFAAYWDHERVPHDNAGYYYESFLNLWGTEAEYRNEVPTDENSPYMIDGISAWGWWHVVEAKP